MCVHAIGSLYLFFQKVRNYFKVCFYLSVIELKSSERKDLIKLGGERNYVVWVSQLKILFQMTRCRICGHDM